VESFYFGFKNRLRKRMRWFRHRFCVVKLPWNSHIKIFFLSEFGYSVKVNCWRGWRFLNGERAWRKMNNSVSDNSFIIESDEEDEEKDLNKGGGDGNDSDSSSYSTENPPQRKPSSYNISWPQSYRSCLFLVLILVTMFFFCPFFLLCC